MKANATLIYETKWILVRILSFLFFHLINQTLHMHLSRVGER